MDKIQKIRKEYENIWHDAAEETPTPNSNILMIMKEEEDINYPPIAGCFHGTNSRVDGRNWGYYNGFCYNEIEPPMKWAYIDDILNIFSIKKTEKDCKWPVSEDLEEAASRYAKEEYSHKNPATLPDRCIGCYAPLMYAFNAGSWWKEEQMMTNATDMVVGYWMPNGLMLTVDEAENCYNIDEGDRVKVIIIKED